jgi:hypothetical protein
MIDKKTSNRLMKIFKINPKVINRNIWNYALNVESEHKDITGNDLILTCKIALAHILEFPNYYQYLKKMESKLEKYWTHKEKPLIFNK